LKVIGLIDGAEVVRQTQYGRMLDVEITLSEWVLEAVKNDHIVIFNRGARRSSATMGARRMN
jgi:hypothetical protein